MQKLMLLFIGCLIVHGSVNAMGRDIFQAAKDGDSELVQAFLDSGENVDRQNDAGQTALHVAIFNNHPNVAQVLIDNHAKVDLQDNCGHTPLFESLAVPSELQLVPMLIAAHANVNLCETNNNLAPLFVAASSSPLIVVQALLAAGADVNMKNWLGWTALDNAKNRPDIFNLLNRVKNWRTVAPEQLLVFACAGHQRLGAGSSVPPIFHANSPIARLIKSYVRRAAWEDALYGHNQ